MIVARNTLQQAREALVAVGKKNNYILSTHRKQRERTKSRARLYNFIVHL